MSLPRDWADPADWADMLSFEPAEFAAEYLLRNGQFASDCRALLEGREPEAGELVGTTEFVARWGLRFPRLG